MSPSDHGHAQLQPALASTAHSQEAFVGRMNDVTEAQSPQLCVPGATSECHKLTASSPQLLYEEWARYGVFYKYQPIDLVR
ncbi:hypothetical protein P7K49_021305 [Saguinus oedipus]|uniref:Anoctamin dimerisation domain-containing protein n=1 Tax=Saguinus oedipus TaxID=9490 RepID=A0ABQ9USB5_SAGOE|nr:hypothetical protein P7K49_021305 [Saguinus oedipus]